MVPHASRFHSSNGQFHRLYHGRHTSFSRFRRSKRYFASSGLSVGRCPALGLSLFARARPPRLAGPSRRAMSTDQSAPLLMEIDAFETSYLDWTQRNQTWKVGSARVSKRSLGALFIGGSMSIAYVAVERRNASSEEARDLAVRKQLRMYFDANKTASVMVYAGSIALVAIMAAGWARRGVRSAMWKSKDELTLQPKASEFDVLLSKHQHMQSLRAARVGFALQCALCASHALIPVVAFYPFHKEWRATSWKAPGSPPSQTVYCITRSAQAVAMVLAATVALSLSPFVMVPSVLVNGALAFPSLWFIQRRSKQANHQRKRRS